MAATGLPNRQAFTMSGTDCMELLVELQYETGDKVLVSTPEIDPLGRGENGVRVSEDGSLLHLKMFPASLIRQLFPRLSVRRLRKRECQDELRKVPNKMLKYGFLVHDELSVDILNRVFDIYRRNLNPQDVFDSVAIGGEGADECLQNIRDLLLHVHEGGEKVIEVDGAKFIPILYDNRFTGPEGEQMRSFDMLVFRCDQYFPKRMCQWCGEGKIPEERVGKSLCSGCKEVRYCSRDCQVKHWKNGHKQFCTKPVIVSPMIKSANKE